MSNPSLPGTPGTGPVPEPEPEGFRDEQIEAEEERQEKEREEAKQRSKDLKDELSGKKDKGAKDDKTTTPHTSKSAPKPPKGSTGS